MNKKPLLSFWQLWNMSFGYLGIQFGFALQNANVSRIFETLGAQVDNIPILWIAAPVSGLIIQPIIGHMSDKTWTRLGRRKPYFLMGALAASLSLLVMPNSPALWVAAGMLWIMDASINISMEPFRAFVGDMLPEEQRTQGFAMQTFFIGIGSVVASLLPYLFANVLHISNTAPEGMIPPSVKWSFYLGGIVFLSSVLWTIFRTKEYSPEELKAFHEKHEVSAQDFSDKISINTVRYYTESFGIIFLGLILTLCIEELSLEKELYILSFGLISYGSIQALCAFFYKRGKINALVEIIYDLRRMPKTMKQLAVVQFFTWAALFSMFIYSTAAITSFHFGSSDPQSIAYNDGADWVGVMMGVYNGVAALVAFILPIIARKTSRVATHAVCLAIGGLGFLSIYFFKDPNWLLLSMTAIGVAWAAILTFPYAILTIALPHHKMGIYMGIFNFFIVIPQIVIISVLGLLMRGVFHGEAIYALVFGGISMLIAAVATLFVSDK
jgi:maltose/moltooligosaccharide transporter